MKSNRRFSKAAIAFLCSATFSVSAEDIDIFLANASVTGARPNVLLILDNAASNNGSITLLDGTSGDKLEMLRQVLNNIVDPLNSAYFPACSGGAAPRTPVDCVTRQEVSDLLANINMGLMIANPSGSGKGGYVRYHVQRMDVAANRTALAGKINPAIPQANNAPYAKSMYEAYQYFGAKPAYVGFDSTLYDPAAKSGSNYVSPATADNNCAENYIVFVGNGGPDSGEENDSKTLLNAIGGVLTTDPISFTPSNFKSSWFDEFARTLKKQDIVPAMDGVQNVTTYTIAVQNPADNSYSTNPMKSARELLKSGAAQGGGEYYEANNGQAVMKAFVDLLRKFQARDSVFAASTLPVSVNVRGTFLNQVYMGQFRPDSGAGPRWPGNLKQYQIGLDVNGNPMLADRFGNGVEDTVNGFILPDKTSFWTVASSYWAFGPLGTPPSASDAPDGNIVEKGGAAQRLRQDFATSLSTRNLYTCNGSCTPGQVLSANLFNAANTGITTASLGAADSTERSNIINWIRGEDNADNEDGNGVATDIRARAHGDLLHSRPAVVNYNRNGDDNDIVVYYGTNEGIFHAVKGGQANTDGGEKWGMVFPEFLSSLKRLRDNGPDISSANPKPYFADGPVSIYQKDGNGDKKYTVAADSDNGDRVYIFVGMRRGARSAYAIDVSDPDVPKHLWSINSSMADFSELGQTWSTLRSAKIKAVTTDPVVIFGAGYDPEHEDTLPATANDKGRGIFVVNATTGALVKFITDAQMGSIPGDLTVVDRDGDGNFDRIYAVDTKANIWRVDIDDANPANWAVYKLASLGGSGADERKFLNKPDVVFGSSYDAVLIGSGDREHPFETTVTNRFYMLKDLTSLVGGLLCETSGIKRSCVESDLTDVTSNANMDPSLIVNGWYLTLQTGEKVVGNAITAAGITYFGTNRPTPPVTGQCSSNLGEARFYFVGYAAGEAKVDANADGVLDRFETLKGGGFPPSPVAAKVVIDGRTVDVVCTGAHCIPPPPSSTSSRRLRTHWYIKR